MVYIILISILSIIIVASICFQKLFPLISLLTATSTLLLGIYQVSKDIKRIDFKIQLLPEKIPNGPRIGK